MSEAVACGTKPIAAGLKPVAAIGDPPAQSDNGNERGDGPPERQQDIGDQAENGKHDPENFSLHVISVRPNREQLSYETLLIAGPLHDTGSPSISALPDRADFSRPR